jgi:hypothetical protein
MHTDSFEPRRGRASALESEPRLVFLSVLSHDQLAILKAIRSGPDGQGAASTEREIEQQFPDHLHFLRQLDAEGYVEVVKVEPEEPGLSFPHDRIYRITEKGEAALEDAAT